MNMKQKNVILFKPFCCWLYKFQKKIAIEDYAISQPHHHAYELYLKSKGKAIDETAHKLSLSNTNIAGATKMG